MVWPAALLLAVVWGAGAFGSPYPWAYTPLLIACLLLGVFGLCRPKRRLDWSNTQLFAVVLVLGAIGLQLIPLSSQSLAVVSPHAMVLVRQYDLFRLLNDNSAHPISIAPARTWLGLAFFSTFALLVAGCARRLTRATATWLAGAIAVTGALLSFV